MIKYCEDCGTRLSGGVCSNCQEELCIMENQILVDGLDIDVSQDFADKSIEQREELKRRKR